MKAVDYILQNWRIRKAVRYLKADVRLIDVGAHQGEFFQKLGERLQRGFGIEPLLKVPIETEKFSIKPGFFPSVRPEEKDWDAITMLAVLEHIPRSGHADLTAACLDLLEVGGRVIITVPGGAVDHILSVLKFLRLIDGMSLEEHFGFVPAECMTIFSEPRFKLLKHQRFQLGMNHLYVFEKQAIE